MVVGEMIEKFRKTSIEKIRKTSAEFKKTSTEFRKTSMEKIRKTSIEKLDKIRKTSRSRRTSRGESASCTCIEYRGMFKILLLGDQGVGKSTLCAQYTVVDSYLLQVLTEDNGQEIYSSCVYMNAGNKKAKQYDLEIAIANGVYWKGSVVGYKERIMESHGFMLVYSKENRQSYMKLVELLSDVRKIKKMVDVPVVIVGNKSDLNSIKTLQVKDTDRHVLGECPHFDVSALENRGIQDAFQCLAQMCTEAYDADLSIDETDETQESTS